MVGANGSVQVVAVSRCRVEQKIPRGAMAWEAFMTRPWGLAGLIVEKDQHENLWQTPTSECLADDEHCCFVGGSSP